MAKSKIEWTQFTWNPIVGCTKVSAGCKNCYAERIHNRRFVGIQKGANLPEQYKQPFHIIQILRQRFYQPCTWKKPRLVFVNSMSDMFHEGVPYEVIEELFDIMRVNRQHTFQILTKRPKRILAFMNWHDKERGREFEFPCNVWIGISVEDQQNAEERLPYLVELPVMTRFISAEPLIGPLNLQRWIDALHWVIVGGETGAPYAARGMQPQWVIDIRDLCIANHVPFFFKRWSARGPIDYAGDLAIIEEHNRWRLLEGRTYDEYPNSGAAQCA